MQERARAGVCGSAPNFLKSQQSVAFKWPVQSEGCGGRGGVLAQLGLDRDYCAPFGARSHLSTLSHAPGHLQHAGNLNESHFGEKAKTFGLFCIQFYCNIG